MGSRNGYAYVEGNPVNRTDPSGECWNTYPTDDWRHKVCFDAFHQRFAISTADGRGYLPEGIEQQSTWGSLTYDAFKESWNRAERIPLGEVAKGGLATTAAAAGATLGLDPSDSITVPTGILIVAGVVCATIAINSIAAYPSYDFAKGEEVARFDWNALERDAVEKLKRNGNFDNLKLLYRGTSLNRAFNKINLYESKLWLSPSVSYATIYAHFDAQKSRDTSAISIYAISNIQLKSLIASENVTEKIVNLEYGFDAIAQSFLIGPIVIPIPDFFKEPK